MSSIRQKILKEIDDRIKRKKDLRAEIANRKDDVEAYVLKLMDEVDEMMSKTVNTSLYEILIPNYVRSLEGHIKTIDGGATIEVSWAENPKRLNGVLIKWSATYQTVNKCDPERYVDIANLLFK